MHIPDGMLDPKTFTTLWAGSGASIGYASWWVRRRLDSSRLVLMAVLAALVFGLQMLNFPIAAGTSGHFSGGAAAAIILGFWPSAIVMAAVLAVQALFFGDGGITTLGANILNLGIAGPCVAALAYRACLRLRQSDKAKAAAAFIAAFLAVLAAAALVALELWTSRRVPLLPALAAMLSWHALIGIGEGIITAGLVTYLAKTRPQLLDTPLYVDKNPATPAKAPVSSTAAPAPVPEGVPGISEPTPTAVPEAVTGSTATSAAPAAGSQRSVVVVFALLALLAAGLSFAASTSPDGLEYVYFETGLGSDFDESGYASQAPLRDYLLPGVANETLAGVGAGIIGVVLTGSLLFTAGTLIVRRRRD